MEAEGEARRGVRKEMWRGKDSGNREGYSGLNRSPLKSSCGGEIPNCLAKLDGGETLDSSGKTPQTQFKRGAGTKT